MIKGSLDGSTGRIYLYYHGPQRAILSDISLQPKLDKEGVATGLRIVLFPNEWTELNFSDIRDKWETGTSQLNRLESSGYLDIFTDIEDVKKLKEQLKDFTINTTDRHGGYVKELADRNAINNYLAEQATKVATPVEEESGFTMSKPTQPKKYFELGTPLVGADSKNTTVHTVNTDTTQFKQMANLIEKQMEQSNKQAEQITKMMETMQQMMLAFASTINKK